MNFSFWVVTTRTYCKPQLSGNKLLVKGKVFLPLAFILEVILLLAVTLSQQSINSSNYFSTWMQRLFPGVKAQTSRGRVCSTEGHMWKNNSPHFIREFYFEYSLGSYTLFCLQMSTVCSFLAMLAVEQHFAPGWSISATIGWIARNFLYRHSRSPEDEAWLSSDFTPAPPAGQIY